jgi:hypothetical protein
VVWHVIEQPNVELSRYRAGQLHITETIPPGRVDWLREQFGEELGLRPTWAASTWASTWRASRLPNQPDCAAR